MSEMSNQNSKNNSVNRAGPVGEGNSPSRCSVLRQQGAGRHPTTVRTKWSKNVKKIVMECFFRSKSFDDDSKPIRGYRQRMMQEWKEHGVFEITEQRLCDQARAIRKNSWKMTEAESEIVNESIEDVEEIQTERDIVRASEINQRMKQSTMWLLMLKH